MLITVQQYDFDLEYKPSSEMHLSDALSCQPISADKYSNLDIYITSIQFSRRLLRNYKLRLLKRSTAYMRNHS